MGRIYSCTTEGEQALAAATAERILWLMGTTAARPRLIEWGVAFQGTSATEGPVQVKLFRCTSAGTTPTATAEVDWDPQDSAADAVAAKAWATEPTREAEPLVHTYVHPQGGLVIQYPLGREPIIDAVTTDGFTIECTAPAAVDSTAYFVWEEG